MGKKSKKSKSGNNEGSMTAGVLVLGSGKAKVRKYNTQVNVAESKRGKTAEIISLSKRKLDYKKYGGTENIGSADTSSKKVEAERKRKRKTKERHEVLTKKCKTEKSEDSKTSGNVVSSQHQVPVTIFVVSKYHTLKYHPLEKAGRIVKDLENKYSGKSYTLKSNNVEIDLDKAIKDISNKDDLQAVENVVVTSSTCATNSGLVHLKRK